MARAVLPDLLPLLTLFGGVVVCLFVVFARLAARDPDVAQAGAGEEAERQDGQDGDETPHGGGGALGPDGVLLGRGQVLEGVERGRVVQAEAVGADGVGPEVGAHLVLEHAAHDGEGQRAAEGHGEPQQRVHGGELGAEHARQVEAGGHEPHARPRAGDAHHDVDERAVAHLGGVRQHGDAGRLDDRADEQRVKGLARVDVADENGEVDSHADPRDVVQQLGAGVRGRVRLDEGEVNPDEVKDRVQGGTRRRGDEADQADVLGGEGRGRDHGHRPGHAPAQDAARGEERFPSQEQEYQHRAQDNARDDGPR